MMKSYTSFGHFLKSQSAKNRRVVKALRALVKKTVPKLDETVKWGNGCFVNGTLPVVYIHSAKDHVQLGFFGGSFLKDPKGMLEGDGQYVRHVKLYSPADITPRTLAPLIRHAAAIDYKKKSQ